MFGNTALAYSLSMGEVEARGWNIWDFDSLWNKNISRKGNKIVNCVLFIAVIKINS